MQPLKPSLGKDFGAVCFGAVALIISTLLFFGDVFKPIILANRLGAPYWQFLVALSAVIAFLCARGICAWAKWDYPYFAFILVFLWTSASALSVGAYAEWSRSRIVREFNPDDYLPHSFFRSLREAPADFQFFLHAAALKSCKPYAWSYREMAFYELPPDVAVNVLPNDWIKRCTISLPRMG